MNTIPTSILMFVLLPISLTGLLAATELTPFSFSQFGLAGLSLGVLCYVMTRTLPQMLREISAGFARAIEQLVTAHAKENEQLAGKIDELRREIAEGRTEQLQLLRSALLESGSIVLAALLLCGSAAAAEIGLVPNDPAAAAANSDKLAAAMDVCQAVDWPLGDVYLARTAVAPPRMACGRWNFPGAAGYAIDPTPQYGANSTRILMPPKTPLLRLCGVGFVIEGSAEAVGDCVSDMVQVEGRKDPATGHHRLAGLIGRNWGCGYHALGGYYDRDGWFVPCQAHADNVRVRFTLIANTPVLFKSDNEQAVNWLFEWPLVQALGGGVYEVTLGEINRGGLVTFDHPCILHPRCTLFRVGEFSDNTNRLECRELRRDRFDASIADQYLRVLDYAGDRRAASWSRWRVLVTGKACSYLSPLDGAKIITAPPELPRDRLQVDVDWFLKGTK